MRKGLSAASYMLGRQDSLTTAEIDLSTGRRGIIGASRIGHALEVSLMRYLAPVIREPGLHK